MSRVLKQAQFIPLGCQSPNLQSGEIDRDSTEKTCHCRCLNQCLLQDEERQQGKRCLVACWHTDRGLRE